jgi:hypothetical protein
MIINGEYVKNLWESVVTSWNENIFPAVAVSQYGW